MKLILVGCEYSGKTTLQLLISAWLQRITGSHRPFFHDHFGLPSANVHRFNSQYPVEIQDEIMALSPKLKEMFQRYVIEYHLGSSFYEYPDHGLVGFHIEEAVYASVILWLRWPRRVCRSARGSPDGIEADIMEKAPRPCSYCLKRRQRSLRNECAKTRTRKDFCKNKISNTSSADLRRNTTVAHSEAVVLDTSEATIDDTFSEFGPPYNCI